MKVITRFAPSPTGNLHIGGLRTALFNFLYARAHSGIFLLRIEDTDTARSKPHFTESILNAMKWLALDYDDIFYQSRNASRHLNVAAQLLQEGKAYIQDGATWLRVHKDAETSFTDLILGDIATDPEHVKDFVIVRSDGRPTYMFAVVVDDHDMGITHIMRGSDHITNTFAQKIVYQAMNWEPPFFAHIPLIHNNGGGKLSKRDGAVDTIEYKQMGILKEALFNYLLRLGWSSGNKEMFSMEEAIQLFNIENIGKSAPRFDMEKLLSLNSYYIKHLDLDYIAQEVKYFIPFNVDRNGNSDQTASERVDAGFNSQLTDATNPQDVIMDHIRQENFNNFSAEINSTTIKKLVDIFRQKYSSTKDIADSLGFLWRKSTPTCELDLNIARDLREIIFEWPENLTQALKDYIKTSKHEAKQVYSLLRIIILGQTESPSIIEIILALGREAVLLRMEEILSA